MQRQKFGTQAQNYGPTNSREFARQANKEAADSLRYRSAAAPPRRWQIGGMMKTKIAVGALLLLLFCTTHCFAEDAIVFNTWSQDGFIYENNVTPSRLMKMPDWSPERGQPPVSQVKAVQIASKYLTKNNPIFKNSKISSIQLRRDGNSGDSIFN